VAYVQAEDVQSHPISKLRKCTKSMQNLINDYRKHFISLILCS